MLLETAKLPYLRLTGVCVVSYQKGSKLLWAAILSKPDGRPFFDRSRFFT
jgi:hypothetical protein